MLRYWVLLLVASNVFADMLPVETACQNRVNAGLIQSAVIGVISQATPAEIFCGAATSERQEFELGSISKSFAGITLAELSLSGKINLEAPIATYIPELQGSYMGTVTAHQLATHSARLVRSYSDAQQTPTWLYDESQLITFLKSYQPDPKKFPPGARVYSNVGFGTLGLVLSRVEAQSYTQLIQKEILAPLGMADTAFILSSSKPDVLEQGYDVLLRPAPYANVSDLGSAAGGVYSDLHDMMIYLRANLGSAQDQSDLGRAMELSHTLGLGWDSLPGTLPTWKNGLMMDGFATIIEFDPNKGLGTVILGNQANGPSLDTLGFIAMGGADTSHQMELSSDFIAKSVGKYVSASGRTTIEVVSVDGKYLGAIQSGQSADPVRLLSIAGEDSKFAVDDAQSTTDQIKFSIDPITNQMKITYFNYEGQGPNGQSTYEMFDLTFDLTKML